MPWIEHKGDTYIMTSLSYHICYSSTLQSYMGAHFPEVDINGNQKKKNTKV